jgi:hypothetical protein
MATAISKITQTVPCKKCGQLTIGSADDTVTDRTDRGPVTFTTDGNVVLAVKRNGVRYVYGPVSAIPEWIEYHLSRAGALGSLLAGSEGVA